MGRIYGVFVHPSGKVVAVAEGFYFTAFLFGGLWAIFSGFVARGLALLAATVGFNILFESALQARKGYAPVFAVAALGISIFIGISAHRWIAKRLRKQGYVYQNSVEAESELEAKKSHPDFQNPVNHEWKRPF
jgi:hypothetical protein